MSNAPKAETIKNSIRRPEINNVDFNILKCIIPRLWKPAPLADMLLALEVIDGPYKGVIFTFDTIEILPHRFDNGMVPAKFSATVRRTIPGFTEDEAWDTFAREIMLAWLSYIAINDFNEMIKIPPAPGIH